VVTPEIDMGMSLEVLEAEALQLSAADRSHLLELLVASLDADPEVEQAWEQVADQREAELDSDSVSRIDGSLVVARLRAQLSR
jgi:hypothetical protein